MSVAVRVLGPDDAGVFLALRRQALLDAPLAFQASPEDDRASSVEAVREQLAGEIVVVGAFEAATLVGSIGLHRDRHRKSAHKVHVWGTYVQPAHRRRGIGALLLDVALAHARTLPDASWAYLAVSEAVPAARALYERAGFHVWGTEPAALRYEGRAYVEHHMALQLRV